jgi:glycerol uptake facilitator-like aquaporin
MRATCVICRLFAVPRVARSRTGGAQFFSELVATFGLVAVVRGCSLTRPAVAPFAVGAYITAGYWFTASTSFANPAVTLARSASDTFAGIRPSDAPAFIVPQILGAGGAGVIFQWLLSEPLVSGGMVPPRRKPEAFSP